MKCSTCKTEMSDNTEKFDSTEKHLLGPGWTHLICKNEKCSELGNGKHVKTEEYIKMQTQRPAMEPLKPKSNKIKGAKVIPGQPLPAEAEQKLLEIKAIQDGIDALTAYNNELCSTDEYETCRKALEEATIKLNKVENTLGITDNYREIAEMTEERNTAIATFGPSLAMDLWGPDSFSKGKKDAVASTDGKTVLLRSKRTNRKIIPTRFIENHPLVLNELLEEDKITITLKVAEEKIGKEDIDKVCEKTTTYSYELVIKDGRNVPQ